MDEIVIPTVQHTGTRFLVSLFPPGMAKSRHTTAAEMPIIRVLLGEQPGLVPMRHPARVYASWARRENTERRKTGLDDQWRNLIALDAEFDLTYFHVDGGNREMELAKLRVFHKNRQSVTSDWEPVGATAKQNSPITEEMISAVPAFVLNFYETIGGTV